MKYLIPSTLDHPEYEWKRYDFSFDILSVVEAKWDKWLYIHTEKFPEVREDFLCHFECNWMLFHEIIWDDEFSWLGYGWLLKENPENKRTYYVGEVVNDWAHWRWTMWIEWDRFDWEFRNWKRNWWWLLRTKDDKYIEWIRRDGVLIDEGFYFDNIYFPDEWHKISVDWNKIYLSNNIPEWGIYYTDVYEYKVENDKLLIKLIDTFSFHEVEETEYDLHQIDSDLKLDKYDEYEAQYWDWKEYYDNLKAENEMDKEWEEREEERKDWHEFNEYYTPAITYVLMRCLPSEKAYEISYSIIEKYNKFNEEISELCKKYWVEWAPHWYNTYWVKWDFKNLVEKEKFWVEKSELFKKYNFDWNVAAQIKHAIEQIEQIRTSWEYWWN